VMGIIVLAVSFVNTEITAFRTLGLIAMTIAGYTFRYVDFNRFLLNNAMFWDVYVLLLQFLVPLLFGIFVRSLFHLRKNKPLRINITVSVVFLAAIIIATAGLLLNRAFWGLPDLLPILIVLRFCLQIHMLISMGLIIYLLIRQCSKKNVEAILFLVGFCILSAFSLPSILTAMGVTVAQHVSLAYLGLVGLLAFMAIAVIKRYFRLLTEYATTVREKAVFRNIQNRFTHRGILVLDAGFRPVSVNKEMLRLIGYDNVEGPSGDGVAVSKSFLKLLETHRRNTGKNEFTIEIPVATMMAATPRRPSSKNLTLSVSYMTDGERIEAVVIQDDFTERDDLRLENFHFTHREEEIIRLCFLGKTNKEIAQSLGITERTVKTHITNIFNKSGVSNKLELLHILRSKD
jgi:DNA-binding CsgD family transcriptional regulator